MSPTRSRTTLVRRAVLVSVIGLLNVTVAAPPAGAAPAAGCAKANGVYLGTTPWAQRQLGLDAVNALSIGAGQRVAVVATGIDPANAQFAANQIPPGADLLAGGPANNDCDGRGTFAAGIIGAQPNSNTTMVGVAPGATLIPIRYTRATENGGNDADPGKLAAAIDAARTSQATVILVAIPVTHDIAALRSAVARAQAAGAIVVSPAVAAKPGQTTYPTSYPGVVAVAGVNETGAPVTAEAGSYISLSAPGVDVASLAPNTRGELGHLYPSKDPSSAAAYVAGVLADLRSYLPALSPPQAVNRVLATASLASAGVHNDRLGWGEIDPLRALTAQLPAGITVPGAAPSARAAKPVPLAQAPVIHHPAGRWLGYLSMGGLALAVLIAIGAVTIRRGQSRGWRPGRATLPTR